jgi:hypothetical protein
MIFDSTGVLLPDFRQLAECWFIAAHKGWTSRINIKGTEPMHRKFITLIVATAIAVTGFSTQVRARDNDVAKTLAGLAVLAIIGAAIHDSKNDKPVVSTRNPNPGYRLPTHRPHQQVSPRPLPPQVARTILPRSCIRTFGPGHQKHTRVLGRHCLSRTYGYTQKLPRVCAQQTWGRKGMRKGFNVHCLKQNGFRISRN